MHGFWSESVTGALFARYLVWAGILWAIEHEAAEVPG